MENTGMFLGDGLPQLDSQPSSMDYNSQNPSEYLQQDGEKTLFICDKLPDKAFIDSVKYFDICKVKITPRKEIAKLHKGGLPDISVLHADGSTDKITRKDFVGAFRYPNGHKVALPFMKEGHGYVLIKSCNSNQKVFRVPNNCLGLLNDKTVKPGCYVVCNSDENNKPDRTSFGIMSSKVFHKTHVIPMQDIIQRNIGRNLPPFDINNYTHNGNNYNSYSNNDVPDTTFGDTATDNNYPDDNYSQAVNNISEPVKDKNYTWDPDDFDNEEFGSTASNNEPSSAPVEDRSYITDQDNIDFFSDVIKKDNVDKEDIPTELPHNIDTSSFDFFSTLAANNSNNVKPEAKENISNANSTPLQNTVTNNSNNVKPEAKENISNANSTPLQNTVTNTPRQPIVRPTLNTIKPAKQQIELPKYRIKALAKIVGQNGVQVGFILHDNITGKNKKCDMATTYKLCDSGRIENLMLVTKEGTTIKYFRGNGISIDNLPSVLP